MAPLYPHIRMSSSFLQWKEQNKFHLSFCNGLSKFIFFYITVGIPLEAEALVHSPSANSENVGI